MKYQFGKPELTCVEIETELGLASGDVREITTYPDGIVEIDTVTDLTSNQRSDLEALLGLKEIVAQ